MQKGTVDKLVAEHLAVKRDELIFALAHQEYSQKEIGIIFNRNRSTVLRILEKMPKDWRPKWIKVGN